VICSHTKSEDTTLSVASVAPTWHTQRPSMLVFVDSLMEIRDNIVACRHKQIGSHGNEAVFSLYNNRRAAFSTWSVSKGYRWDKFRVQFSCGIYVRR
jgi:hypothetical protein